MTIELLIEILIVCVVGVGTYQINKWIQFKYTGKNKFPSKFKYIWNSIVFVFCLAMYGVILWYVFDS